MRQSFLLAFAPTVPAFVIGIIVSFYPRSTIVFCLGLLYAEALWSMILAFVSVWLLSERKWVSVLSLAIFTLTSWPTILLLISPTIGDYIHFLALYPYYANQVGLTKDRTEQASFFWGTSGFVNYTDKWLVYDETGNAADVATGYSNSVDISVHHLMGNFYIVSASY